MTLKQTVNRVLSSLTSGLGRMIGAQSLPSHFNGMWVTFTRSSWTTLHQTYEPYIAEVLRANLRPGGVFLDVGSHFGVWSVYAAGLVGHAGRVLAFEPSPAFAILKANADLNPPVQAFNMGLGAQDGEVTFFDQGTSSSGSFVNEVTKINAPFQPDVPVGGTRVKMRTLDSVVAESGARPDLIKVDVEGFELEVMRGADRLLRDVRPVMLIEIHPRQLALSGGSEQALMACLREAGYAVDVIDRNPNSLYTIRATPTPTAGAASPR